MRFAPLALAALLALAACRTEEPMQMPPATTLQTYEQSVRTAPDVAGTYQLIGMNDRAVPTRATVAEGCVVTLNGGTLALGMDGRYRFELVTASDCGRGEHAAAPTAAQGAPGAHAAGEAIQKEGLYTVRGNEVRFGNKIRLTLPEDAPEANAGSEALVAALFDHGRFDANGIIRDTVLAVTMNDLRTYVFSRARGAAPPETAPRRALTPTTAPTSPVDRPTPTEGEAAAEDFFPTID